MPFSFGLLPKLALSRNFNSMSFSQHSCRPATEFFPQGELESGPTGRTDGEAGRFTTGDRLSPNGAYLRDFR